MPSLAQFLWYDSQAVDAAKFYKSIFKKHFKEHSPIKGGKQVMAASFSIFGQDIIAFNGGPHHTFTPASSLFITVETQKEVDYYWSRLLKGGREDACGWLQDRYGLSWQVVPSILGKLLGDKDPAKAGRAMNAMLQMKKLDIAALKKAHAGKA